MNKGSTLQAMTQTVDGYCERLGPGLLAEPINALTNLAFLAAALWLATKLARNKSQGESVDASAAYLVVVLWLIGLGSLAFHTFANRLTALFDVLPIAVFIFSYVFLALRRFFSAPVWLASLGPPSLFGLSMLFAKLGVGGASGYLPALVGLLALGLAAHRQQPAVSSALFQAAAVFGASLTLRTLDQPLCQHLPLGTHWLWHMLNAVTLFLVTRTYILHGRSETDKKKAAFTAA